MLFAAIKARIEQLFEMGCPIEQLETELRLDLEAALQLGLSEVCTDIPPPSIDVGGTLVSRDEAIDMITSGIAYPQDCMSTEKIVEGLSLYISGQYRDNKHSVKHDGFSSIYILDEEGLEQIYIAVDHEKIHVFHGQHVDPRHMSAIKEVTLIFPMILEFVNHMKSIHGEKSDTDKADKQAETASNKKEKKDKPEPDFDWI